MKLRSSSNTQAKGARKKDEKVTNKLNIKMEPIEIENNYLINMDEENRIKVREKRNLLLSSALLKINQAHCINSINKAAELKELINDNGPKVVIIPKKQQQFIPININNKILLENEIIIKQENIKQEIEIEEEEVTKEDQNVIDIARNQLLELNNSQRKRGPCKDTKYKPRDPNAPKILKPIKCKKCLIKLKSAKEIKEHQKVHEMVKLRMLDKYPGCEKVEMLIENIGPRRNLHVLLPNRDYAFTIYSSMKNKMYLKCHRGNCKKKGFCTPNGEYFLLKNTSHNHGDDSEMIGLKIRAAKAEKLTNEILFRRQIALKRKVKMDKIVEDLLIKIKRKR
jgi:hypothetical protein